MPPPALSGPVTTTLGSLIGSAPIVSQEEETTLSWWVMDPPTPEERTRPFFLRRDPFFFGFCFSRYD